MTKPDESDAPRKPVAPEDAETTDAETTDSETGEASGPVIDVTPETVSDAPPAPDGETDDETGDEADKPAKRRPVLRIVALIALVLVVGLAVATYMLGPRLVARLDRALHEAGLPAPATSAAIAGLDARVATLDTRLATLEAAVAKPPSEPVAEALAGRLDEQAGKIEALSGRLDRLAARIEEVAAQPAPVAIEGDAAAARLSARLDAIERALKTAKGRGDAAALERKIADLAQRNAALEKRLAAVAGRLSKEIAALGARKAGAAARGAGLVLAVGQLREALRGSGGYADELAAVRALAGDDPTLTEPLATLARHAETGVATRAALRARFSALADRLVRAAVIPPEGNWVQRTLARLGSLVTVRPVGEVAGETAEAIVARAETRLEAGDLAAAVAELEALKGAPAKLAEPWLEDARARLAVDRAAAALAARGAVALGDAG